MKTISVHGYQYDPHSTGKHNPAEFHRDMGEFTGTEIIPFSWYSYPPTLMAIFRAYRKGYFVRPLTGKYRAAFDDALHQASRLADLANMQAEPVNIIAHSLGTRVVLQALNQMSKGSVGRIVLLNGAEKAINAQRLVDYMQWPILNLSVKEDDVLNNLGSWADPGLPGPCIGTVGLDSMKHKNFIDVRMDNQSTKDKAHDKFKWNIRGDNPDQYADHWYTYKSAINRYTIEAQEMKPKSDNAIMVQEFLNGKNLTALAI